MRTARKRSRTYRFEAPDLDPELLDLAERAVPDPGGDPDIIASALGMAIDSLAFLRQVMEAHDDEPDDKSTAPSPLREIALEGVEEPLEDDDAPLHLETIRVAARTICERRTGGAGFLLEEAEWLRMLRGRYVA